MSISADLDAMARTVWGEARGESFEGQVAVAHVIANRAARPSWWGRDIEGVCKAPLQFSCNNPSDPNYRQVQWVSLNEPSFLRAHGIAALVMSGDLPDFSQGATNYHSTDIQAPSWTEGLVPTVQIGKHKFYREGTK